MGRSSCNFGTGRTPSPRATVAGRCCIRHEEDHTMTLSGPTRLLAAAGAVVALTITGPG